MTFLPLQIVKGRNLKVCILEHAQFHHDLLLRLLSLSLLELLSQDNKYLVTGHLPVLFMLCKCEQGLALDQHHPVAGMHIRRSLVNRSLLDRRCILLKGVRWWASWRAWPSCWLLITSGSAGQVNVP